MNEYFTISQLCRSCGVSRATILRLESRGLLTPAYVDAANGYRYYDNYNVAWVMQIQLFLSMGMSYGDILLYQRTNGASSQLLNRMEERIRTLQRTYSEMQLRITHDDAPHFDFMDLPGYVCFTGTSQCITAADSFWAMYRLYHQAVERGYRLLYSEPLFVVSERDDFIRDGFVDDASVRTTCCVPLDPAHAPEDAVEFAPCRVFTCLYHGSYSRRVELFNAFGQKIRELGLKPAGPVRILGLVAPYTSSNISPDNYVTRLAVPVEE